ncbi:MULTISPECIES: class I SAM-dependent methyltransferase [Actinopolyspora]|uniref:Methyltransferase domain-containing protein n=1 Tax=Actinopolyspora saharensis TaxID=995062 RepID=A0A1H0ZT82_9ACTN|nr:MULTISPECIES: class I SAM-dependent methyltransferase [Actinopolyspora]NHD15592.1 class I SAM-dependent methyltransferase [Actinopolyspora sp. BKK2]NHE75195.1 class I SAM-dependent methyltransferase [Actinopolyspora sp. BKK1]SDQ30627.1 Methyltransferase domain-containing protein [Actinopolyspora saharensis]
MCPPAAAENGRHQLDPVALSVARYSEHAADYAHQHAGKMRDRVERFTAALPDAATILDAGCGPGRDLARFTAAGHLAQGIDLNPEFASMANACAPTLLGDLREVGSLFAAETFDGIWACACLVHLPTADTRDVLGQFATLLRPAGKLYACVKAVGETGWLDEPDARRWYTVWTPERFTEAVRQAGFDVDGTTTDVFVEVWASRSG